MVSFVSLFASARVFAGTPSCRLKWTFNTPRVTWAVAWDELSLFCVCFCNFVVCPASMLLKMELYDVMFVDWFTCALYVYVKNWSKVFSTFLMFRVISTKTCYDHSVPMFHLYVRSGIVWRHCQVLESKMYKHYRNALAAELIFLVG